MIEYIWSCVAIHVHNRYLCAILAQTCKLNGYKPKEYNSNKSNSLAEKIFNLQNKKSFREIKFEKIGELIPESEIIEELIWIKEEIEFAIKIFDKHNLNIDTSSIENILKSL